MALEVVICQACQKCLTHEEGIGSPCTKCKENCSGLEIHFWRKVCKNCGCAPELHDVRADESLRHLIVNSLMNDQDDDVIDCSTDDEVISSHPLLCHLARKKKTKKRGKLRDDENNNEVYSSDRKSDCDQNNNNLNGDVCLRINGDGNLKVMNGQSNKVKSSKNKGKTKEEARVRRQSLQRQVPPQDFDDTLCDDLDDYERQEMKYFTELVQQHMLGRAQLKIECPQEECSYCSKAITSSHLVVERMENRCWHKNCLRCHVCKEVLVDGIYFLHGKQIYCGRHFGEIYRPRCNACDELIFSRYYTNADDKSWHTKHFRCYRCDTNLEECSYVIQNSSPHCFDCYQGDKCRACNRPITDEDDVIEDWWHSLCYSCNNCAKSLVGCDVNEEKGKVYCRDGCFIQP